MSGIICCNCETEVDHAGGIRSETMRERVIAAGKNVSADGAFWICTECGQEDDLLYEAEHLLRDFNSAEQRAKMKIVISSQEEFRIRQIDDIDILCKQLRFIYKHSPFSQVNFSIQKIIKFQEE